MEIKIFGKSLFEFSKSKGLALTEPARQAIKESKFLPDFIKVGRNEGRMWDLVESSTIIREINAGEKNVEKKKEPEKEKLTPKGVYDLKLLNDETFKLNADPKYVEEQLTEFQEKLGLIKSEEFDMRRGVEEIASIIVRFENRKKYPEFRKFYEQFPYTVPSRVDAVIKDNNYLKLGEVAQFLADMPKEATQAMKDYNKYTKELCGKQAVFYIIADKKDFEKTSSRRDPILLAQSPFGHFWQILGAWDKEMLLLEQL